MSYFKPTSVVPDYLRFGVEMELNFPPNVNYRSAITWQEQTDRSIQCNRGQRCQTAEFVSGILSGENGVKSVSDFIKTCKRVNANVNNSTGFHVHISINMRKFSLEDLKRLCHNYIKYEKSINLFMDPSRLNNSYCMSNRDNLAVDNCEAKDAIYNCDTIDELVALVSPTRYHKLNLHALYKYGTIEFRQHKATLNLNDAEGWIRFLLSFVSNSLLQPRSLALLNNRTCEFGYEAMFKYVIKNDELRNFYMRKKSEISQRSGQSSCICDEEDLTHQPLVSSISSLSLASSANAGIINDRR